MELIGKRLQKLKKVYVTEHELSSTLGVTPYSEYCLITEALVNEGIIEGVSKAGKNNKVPKNFKKFRILRNSEKHPLVAELEFLYPKFSSYYYKDNIEELEADFQYIKKLSTYLNANTNRDSAEVSINERSFEIFGDEKFLELKGRIILNKLRLDIAILNVYKTREPFFDFITNQESNWSILIVENKDTWYSLKKVLMKYGRLKLFDVSFQVLIYGEGWKILKSFEFIEEKHYVHNIKDIYYIGDLDYEGISIFQSLTDKYKNFSIKPLIHIYKKMVDKTDGIQLRMAEKDQKRYKIEEFLNLMGIHRDRAFSILNSGQYIPQEILTYVDFIKMQEEIESV
jgi:hypothetical protein